MPADIAGATSNYNFHSHTQWCDGHATIERMTVAAIEAGMEHWGFSPHSPVPIVSSCNMDAPRVPEYLAEVGRLKDIFGDRIALYTSMEIDYLGPDWGPANEYFRTIPLDYRIGSVHFVESPRDGMIDIDGRPESFKIKMERLFDGDIRGVVERFFEQSCRMVEEGGFDIIGHFDKIHFNATSYSPGIDREEWYVALVDDLIGRIAAAGITAEVNTKAFDTSGTLFPDTSVLPKVIAAGIPLVVNSDAHYPDKVNAGREGALNLLSTLGATLKCR